MAVADGAFLARGDEVARPGDKRASPPPIPRQFAKSKSFVDMTDQQKYPDRQYDGPDVTPTEYEATQQALDLRSPEISEEQPKKAAKYDNVYHQTLVANIYESISQDAPLLPQTREGRHSGCQQRGHEAVEDRRRPQLV